MSGIVPEGYTRLRDAIYVVAEIVHAGRDAKAAVKAMRDQDYCEVRFTIEQLADSAAVLWEEIDRTHIITNRVIPIDIWAEQPSTGTLLSIDPAMFADIPHVRKFRGGTLAFLRPGHYRYEQFSERFRPPFNNVGLLLKTEDLNHIGRNLRRTQKRKAHQSASAEVGRPSIKNAVRDAVLAIESQRKWSAATDSLKMLMSLLSRPPYNISTSESTVKRVVDQLAEEGLDRFRRTKKLPKRHV